MNKNILKIIGPGLLIAATGVGAGDLAGGAFAGSKLGLAILWAVLLGAFFKYVITEGLARYQLATGNTILEGLFSKYGRPVQIFFLIYLLIWSFAAGSALISASGVATHALIPIFDSPDTGKIVWGILLSLTGLAIAWHGSYHSFEKIMSGLVGFMFVTVVVTAIFIKPDLTEFIKGMFIPLIPDYINPEGKEQGVMWTLALMGGVGGTLTILSYGYWIREKGRAGHDFLKTCRLDLAVAYIVTALFGIAMIVISYHIDLDRDSSSKLVINLALKLNDVIGTTGSVMFLFGAWAAVFSSLLGVWQSVPYMFTDFYNMFNMNRSGNNDLSFRRNPALRDDEKSSEHEREDKISPFGRNDKTAFEINSVNEQALNHTNMHSSNHTAIHPFSQTIVNTRSFPYRIYLVSIALLPMLGLAYKFVLIQKIYAVLGSLVIPLISIALLMLN
ncbi:Nramp family divalent metal transporter, partial [Bacteroidota bacterium]